MSNYDETNKGAIWGNKDKQEANANPNWPDYKGSINIEGKEYWLSGWKRKEGAHPNAPAMSLSVQAKDDVHKQGVEDASQAAQGNNIPDFESDSIPF